MRPSSDTAPHIIARLASRHHGVVTHARLRAAGVSVAEIKSRLRSGALIPVHRGVYRVGHRAPSVEATYLAAVWACGEGALLCGLAAAHLLGLVREPPRQPEVLARNRRSVAGVLSRRTRVAHSLDAWTWRGIPVTRVPRTLIDLAPILPASELARAVHEARVKHGTRPEHVLDVLARRPNSPGAGKIRSILVGDTR